MGWMREDWIEVTCVLAADLKIRSSWICKKKLTSFTIYALYTWTLLTLPLTRFRNYEKNLFDVIIGRTDI